MTGVASKVALLAMHLKDWPINDLGVSAREHAYVNAETKGDNKEAIGASALDGNALSECATLGVAGCGPGSTGWQVNNSFANRNDYCGCHWRAASAELPLGLPS
jgi:hypothetical protein